MGGFVVKAKEKSFKLQVWQRSRWRSQLAGGVGSMENGSGETERKERAGKCALCGSRRLCPKWNIQIIDITSAICHLRSRFSVIWQQHDVVQEINRFTSWISVWSTARNVHFYWLHCVWRVFDFWIDIDWMTFAHYLYCMILYLDTHISPTDMHKISSNKVIVQQRCAFQLCSWGIMGLPCFSKYYYNIAPLKRVLHSTPI